MSNAKLHSKLYQVNGVIEQLSEDNPRSDLKELYNSLESGT